MAFHNKTVYRMLLRRIVIVRQYASRMTAVADCRMMRNKRFLERIISSADGIVTETRMAKKPSAGRRWQLFRPQPADGIVML
jgi:hypothetical protein